MTKATQKHRKFGIGALSVIVGLLLASGLLRMAGAAGPVMAVPAVNVEEGPVSGVGQCDPAESPQALLDAIRAREGRNTLREGQIADRMEALAVAEAEINAKIIALEAAEASLSELLSIATTAAEDDLNRLTQVYENMKPTDAAALFETMEPGFSAGFMGRMRPEAAAAIMTNLTPETAYLISVLLAGRNANAPTQ